MINALICRNPKHISPKVQTPKETFYSFSLMSTKPNRDLTPYPLFIEGRNFLLIQKPQAKQQRTIPRATASLIKNELSDQSFYAHPCPCHVLHQNKRQVYPIIKILKHITKKNLDCIPFMCQELAHYFHTPTEVFEKKKRLSKVSRLNSSMPSGPQDLFAENVLHWPILRQ